MAANNKPHIGKSRKPTETYFENFLKKDPRFFTTISWKENLFRPCRRDGEASKQNDSVQKAGPQEKKKKLLGWLLLLKY